MTLKEMLVDYRREHGLSQRQFASMCGLSNGYISMLEKESNPATGEKIVPTLQALYKLSKGMGITLTDLLTTIDDMPVDISFHPEHDDVTDSDLEVIALLHKLPSEKRREFMSYLRFLASGEASE